MNSTPVAPPLIGEVFYDARRDVYYAKPVLRGWLHLLWFEASLVLGPLLLARAHGATRIAATAIYAASVSALFGVSALYHRGNWTAAWRERLQRLDHAMIFFLIAGTATPAFLLANRGAFGLVCLIVLWALTLTAAAIHMVWMNAPELMVGATFVGLGWVAGLALPGGVDPCRCHARSADAGGWPTFTRPGRFLTIAAGPTRTRRCSAITRSSTPASAPLRRASMPR
jgi:channel protein (hemolysin III family)